MPEDLPRPRNPLNSRGDVFAGGCLALILLLLEIPVAFVLILALGLEGWAGSNGSMNTGMPPMDWAPVLYADRGYDFDKYRRLLRRRGIKPLNSGGVRGCRATTPLCGT
ncbi:hypothetical protein [Streptomyces sp. NPDC050564]|uniref:hypothetical protein n=1 Tax=Streptomyces sp. NPDC050564 TaxID=3365631 RepID=UPI00378FF1D7